VEPEASQATSRRERDSSLDALKALAIAMVVSGHAMLFSSWVLHPGPGLVQATAIGWVSIPLAKNWWFNFVQFVQMPLFALVSGIVMWPPRSRPLGQQVLKRVTSLLVPYACWFILYFFAAYRALDLPPETFSRALIDGVVGRGGGLWYLYTLFICSVAVLLVQRIPRPRLWLGVSAIVAAFLRTGVLFRVSAVFALYNVLWIYPFVAVGSLVAPHAKSLLKYRWATAVACLGVFVVMFYELTPVLMEPIQRATKILAWSQRNDRRLASHGIHGGFLLNSVPLLLPFAAGLAGSIGFWSVAARQVGPVIDGLAWVGRKSLGIYVMHFPVVLALVGIGLRNPAALTATALVATSLLTIVVERVPVASNLLLGQSALPWREMPTLKEPSEKVGL
jgi:fucose 4-O-acetylase-like acetyltransferase